MKLNDMKLHRIGVIGAGTIGTGVITDIVMHGLHAVVIDQSPEALARNKAQVLENARLAPHMSKTLPRVSRDELLQRMEHTTELSAAEINARINMAYNQIQEALVFSLQPPPVLGLGNANGLELYVEDRAGLG